MNRGTNPAQALLAGEIEFGFRELAEYERRTGADRAAIEWCDALIEDVADDLG